MDPKTRGILGIVVGLVLLIIGFIVYPIIVSMEDPLLSAALTGILFGGGAAGIIVGLLVLTGVIKKEK